MSKQSEAKKNQNYVSKAIPHICMNCNNYACAISVKTYEGWYGDIKEREEIKDEHCVIGEFVVKKMGSCDLFEMKE
jgi:hypothetical protein